jgi:sugar O-acyltransferase (sialic acid O-acetyltransferase NeuD family)
MKKKLVVLGDGGHARAVVDVALSTGEFEIEAVVGINESNKALWGKIGVTWVSEEGLERLANPETFAIVGLGQIKDPEPRAEAFLRLTSLGFELATVVAPSSYVSKSADIGKGSIVMHGAVVNAHARIGENTIINSLALVEHDAVVGSHSHVSTRAVINGECRIGDNTFVGSGAIVKNSVLIGARCVVPMGALVFADLPDGQQASGLGR